MSRISDQAGGLLRAALSERVVIDDSAMGSMLQGSAATIDDFAGHEGCNEILNVTRPDIVREVHEGYLDAGVDAISTNTFGANLGNLGEYGIADRIYELARAGQFPCPVIRAGKTWLVPTAGLLGLLGLPVPGTSGPDDDHGGPNHN